MSEPHSVRNEPYSDFPRQSYSVFTDDYCHEKSVTVKPSIKTARSVVKLKETVSQKNGKFSFADETKLWFNLPRAGSIYAKIKSGDYLRLHYDDGLRTIQGRQFYFYGGVNSNRSLQLSSVKLGVGHDSEHCHSDNRVKVSLGKSNSLSYHWYSRTMVYHGNFRFGLVTCLDVCNRVLQKNNVLLGYSFDANTQGFIRAEVNGFRNVSPNLSAPESIFDKVTVDVVRKWVKLSDLSTTTFGLEAGYSIRQKQINNVQAVVQYQNVQREVLKLGVNRKLDLSLLVKKPWNWWDNFATISAGAHVSGVTSGNVNVKTGFEIALNL